MNKLIVGENDLATTDPILTKQWNTRKNTIKPTEVTRTSCKKVWWICEKGHEWEATISHRVHGTNCPVCSGHKVLVGYNDLSSRNPEIASEWNALKNESLTPMMVTSKSNKKVWWICHKCGKEWIAAISDRTEGQGCPACGLIRRAQKRSMPKPGESLEDINPDLSKEWNYGRNSLTPMDVRASSNKIVWWKCEKGHEWKTSICNRHKRGDKCPYCSRKKVLKGFNDLSTTHPIIADEWDYDKNTDMLPDDILAGSNKKVWWKCKYGHEWQASPNNRTSAHTQCPVCKSRIFLKGFNDIETLYPDLMKEWDYNKNTKAPSDYMSGAYDEVWWICRRGHEWKARINNRTLGHRGCPICAKEFRTSFPEQAIYFYIKENFDDAINEERKTINGMELDIYIPSINTAIEYDGVAWHDTEEAKNREIKKNKACLRKGIKLIRIRECGLDEYPDCICIMRKRSNEKDLVITIKKLLTLLGIVSASIDLDRDRGKIQESLVSNEKDNSLEEVYPNVAKTWNYAKNGNLKPTMIMPRSQKKVWWICEKGHEWVNSVNNRVVTNGCPVCNNIKVESGYNDLISKYPLIAKEWDCDKNQGMMPSDVKYNSYEKYWWKCKQGHVWQASVNSRTMRNAGCPYCSSKKIAAGYNDLATRYPEISEEWDFDKNGHLTPRNIAAASSKTVWWKCKQGHEWQAKVLNRTLLQRGCPYCYGRYAVAGVTDLETKNPILAKEWNYGKNNGLKPSDVLPNSAKKVWWICEKGHEWEANIQSRTRGNGCPYCSGKKVIQGLNDLSTTHPEIASQWDNEKNGAYGGRKRPLVRS